MKANDAWPVSIFFFSLNQYFLMILCPSNQFTNNREFWVTQTWNWTSETESSMLSWWWHSLSVSLVAARLALCGGQSSPPLGLIALFFLCTDVSSRARSGFVVDLEQYSLSNYWTKSCFQRPISFCVRARDSACLLWDEGVHSSTIVCFFSEM